jgi:hypothetical protein
MINRQNLEELAQIPMDELRLVPPISSMKGSHGGGGGCLFSWDWRGVHSVAVLESETKTCRFHD